jgi:uncharacterized protein YacL
MKGANFWAVIFGLTLFMLGIDSSFSTLEATSTVIHDTKIGMKTPRKLVALILCICGVIFSLVYCFNWGFTMFDVVDHYLNVYLMLLMGVLECLAVGWIYEAEDIIKKVNKATVVSLFVGYWVTLFVAGIMTFTLIPDKFYYGMLAYWVTQIVTIIVSWRLSGLSYKEWHFTVAMYGVRKLSRTMTQLTRAKGAPRQKWEDVFDLWWGVSIKFISPFMLWFLLTFSIGLDLKNNYGGYHVFWQCLGLVFPIMGMLIFIVAAFVCTEKDPN